MCHVPVHTPRPHRCLRTGDAADEVEGEQWVALDLYSRYACMLMHACACTCAHVRVCAHIHNMHAHVRVCRWKAEFYDRNPDLIPAELEDPAVAPSKLVGTALRFTVVNRFPSFAAAHSHQILRGKLFCGSGLRKSLEHVPGLKSDSRPRHGSLGRRARRASSFI